METDTQIDQLTHFTDEESFGLFMEGLRALQLYEDETAHEHPTRAMLERWMETCLGCLRQCVAVYPFDLLPKFYLGVAFTLKNQEIYVGRLVQLKEEYQARGRYLAFRDKKIAQSTTHVATNDFLEERMKGELSQSKGIEQLSQQPWPMLKAATRLFRELLSLGGPEVKAVATYNLAQVCARRGNEFLHEGLDLLGDPELVSVGGFVTQYKPRSWGDRLQERLPWHEIDRRKDQEKGWKKLCESIALALQFDSLRKSLHVRLLADGPLTSFNQAWDEFEKVGKNMESEESDLFFMADLLADHYAKGGYILCDRVLRVKVAEPEEVAGTRLAAAVEKLNCALEHKEQWNPAQVYLATVRRLQAGMAEGEVKWLEWQCDQAIKEKKPGFERDIEQKKREQERLSAASDELFVSLQGTTAPPPPPKFGDG